MGASLKWSIGWNATPSSVAIHRERIYVNVSGEVSIAGTPEEFPDPWVRHHEVLPVGGYEVLYHLLENAKRSIHDNGYALAVSSSFHLFGNGPNELNIVRTILAARFIVAFCAKTPNYQALLDRSAPAQIPEAERSFVHSFKQYFAVVERGIRRNVLFSQRSELAAKPTFALM